MKQICKSFAHKLKSFTLIEVLVALSIIGIATLSTLTIFANLARYSVSDKRMQLAVETANNHLSQLYLAKELKTTLFDAKEISNINTIRRFPLRLKPQRINIEDDIFMLVNKKIVSYEPLLVDVGIEVIIPSKVSNQKARHYWVETTLSESYMNKLE